MAGEVALNTTPAATAPTASTASGNSMTIGNSCGRMMAVAMVVMRMIVMRMSSLRMGVAMRRMAAPCASLWPCRRRS